MKTLTSHKMRLLIALFPAIVLAGCGGGTITIETPQSDQVYLKSDAIEFAVGFTDLNAIDANFQLNGEDITSDFIIDADNNRATLSVPANTVLDERSQITISVDGNEESTNFFVDRSAPEIVVTHFSPNLLGNLPHLNITIEGYVTDLSPLATQGLLAPQVRYGVNFHDRIQYFELDENNQFSITIETEAMGNTVPDNLESAPIRFLISDATPFTAGLQTSNDTYASSVRQPPFAKAHITNTAFENIINPKINDAISDVNFEALATAANPAVNEDIVLSDIPYIPEVNIPIPGIPDPNLLGLGAGIRVDVTSLDIGSLDINAAPTTDNGKPSLFTDVSVNDLDIRIRTALSIELPILPDPTIPINTRINGSDIVGDLLVRLKVDGNQNLAPKLAIDSIDMDLSVIGGDFDTFDFSGLPWPLDVALGALTELFVGAVEQFAFELMDDWIANMVGDALADSTIDKVNEELQLIPSSLSTDFRGKEFDFYASEAAIQANANGLSVTVSKSDVTVRPFESGIIKELGWQINEGGSFKNFSATTPTNGVSYDMGLSLDWDFLNKTLYEAHRAGVDIITTEFAGADIPAIGNQLSNADLRVTVRPTLAPYFDKPIPRRSPAIASVNAKEFSVVLEAKDNSTGEVYRNVAEVRANIRSDIDLDLDGNNFELLLDANPEITIRSMTINENEQLIGEVLLQGIIDFAVPVVMPRIVDIIGEIRLPCIKDHTLDLLELETSGYGHFNIYANVNDSVDACTDTSRPTEPDPQPPAAPNVHVEFVGCNNSTPQFVVDVTSGGGEPNHYNTQVSQGGSTYRNFNDTLYDGSSSRNDIFRANACNEHGCGAYGSNNTGSISCGGTGGGGGDEPPTHPK